MIWRFDFLCVRSLGVKSNKLWHVWQELYDFIPSLLVMHAQVVTAQPQQNHNPVSTMISLVIFLTWYQGLVMGFFLTTSRPGKVTVAPGDKVTLFCAVDDDYEWCKFYNPSGQFCDFEWKRRKGNITMQECQFAGRVRMRMPFMCLLF